MSFSRTKRTPASGSGAGVHSSNRSRKRTRRGGRATPGRVKFEQGEPGAFSRPALSAPSRPLVGIDYRVSRYGALVHASSTTTTVSVVDKPYPGPASWGLQHHYVSPASRHHARGGRCTREPEPVGRKPQVPARLPEHAHGGTAAAEQPGRAARGMRDDLSISCGDLCGGQYHCQNCDEQPRSHALSSLAVMRWERHNPLSSPD